MIENNDDSSPIRKILGENIVYDQMNFNSSEIIVDKTVIDYPNKHYYNQQRNSMNSSFKENMNYIDPSTDENSGTNSFNSKLTNNSFPRRGLIVSNNQPNNNLRVSSSFDDNSHEKKNHLKFKYKDAKSSIELCEFFQVNSFDVFDGG